MSEPKTRSPADQHNPIVDKEKTKQQENGEESTTSNGEESTTSNGDHPSAVSSRSVSQTSSYAYSVDSNSRRSSRDSTNSRANSGREVTNASVASIRSGAFSGRSTLKHDHFGSASTLSSTTARGDDSNDVDEQINVVIRIRPLNTREQYHARDRYSVTFPGAGQIECDNNGNTKQFAFNVVFEPEATQSDIFENSGVKKLIDMAVKGYACTALAFGQTGSGKTHTMTGPPRQSDISGELTQFEGGKYLTQGSGLIGVMQRSFDYLFKQLQQNTSNRFIRASYLEIYNEQVIDLLNPVNRRFLNVRWSKHKGFYVENLFIMECDNMDDLLAVLEEGMKNRQIGSHDLNATSSRSHTMLTLTIDTDQQDPDDETVFITKRGKLTFVDLAGSEKVKDSNSTAGTLIETNNINRSLLVLGTCISSLGDPKKRQGHIPYRDSKLTKLLADSLGGNGVTLMIACITPSSHHASETMSTLRYASRAKKIRTKPIVKMDPREKLILSLKREIKTLNNENIYLRQQLKFPAHKAKGGNVPQNNDEKLKHLLKNKKDEEKTDEGGLYEMLQEYMIENEALRSENADLQVSRDKMKRDQQLLFRDNEKMMQKIEDLDRLSGQSPWQGNTAFPGYKAEDGVKPPSQPLHMAHQSSGMQPSQGGPIRNNQNTPPQNRYPGNNNPPMNGISKVKSSVPGKGPPPPHAQGQPKRPPHRLSDTIVASGRQNGTPPSSQHYNDPQYQGQNLAQLQHPSQNTYQSHPQPPRRQESPIVSLEGTSRVSTAESVRSLNEKLKLELADLEGEIQEHQKMNNRNRSIYGSIVTGDKR